MKYVLPVLPYGYGALEPYIDARTVELHYSKHHQAYINNLNQALELVQYKAPENVEEILCDLSKIPGQVRQKVRDNGGGFYNHNLYWQILRPKEESKALSGKLKDALMSTFGSFDVFKKSFNEISVAHVGSGWTWLYLDEKKQLKIGTTLNHDNPLMLGYCALQGRPVLVMDLWEHAYYLKYQNRKLEYMENFWNLVAWDQVERNYLNALAK